MHLFTRCLFLLGICLFAEPSLADEKVIGKIEGNLNGVPTIWYLLYSSEDATHSALMFDRGEGVTIGVLGGYESMDISFGKGESGNPTVSGPGSTMTIQFSFPAGTNSASYELPDHSGVAVGIVHMSRVGDYSSMSNLVEGKLNVTDIEVSANGQARFAGTFSGEFESMEETSTPMSITDGRFEVEGARRMQLTPVQ